MTTFDSAINGIPCRIKVTAYSPPVGSNRNCDPLRDPCDPGEFSFQIFDRKGYDAPWLEALMTHADEDRIYQEFLGEQQ